MQSNIKLLWSFIVFWLVMSITNVYGSSLYVNDGEIYTISGNTELDQLINKGTIENDYMLSVMDGFQNNASIIGDNGSLGVTQGTNEGSITQKNFVISESFINNGSIDVTDTLSVANINNTQSIIAKRIKILGTAKNTSVINAVEIINNGTLTGEGGKLFVSGGINKKTINQYQFTNDGTFENNSRATLLAEIITNSANMTNFGKIGSNTKQATITNSGTFINSGNIISSTIENLSGSILQNNSNITSLSIINNGKFFNSGVLNSPYIENQTSGIFNNSYDLTTTSIKNNGIFNNTNKLVVTNLENNNRILGTGQLEILNGLNSGSIEQNEINIKQALSLEERASIVVDALINNSNSIIENKGTITIRDTLSNVGLIDNKGIISVEGRLDNTGTLITSGVNSIFQATNIASNDILGIYNNASVTLESINNTNGKIYLTNNGILHITNQSRVLDGDLIVQDGENNSFSLSNGSFVGEFGGNINIIGTNTTLNFKEGRITQDANVTLSTQSGLNINNNASLVLNSDDRIVGDLVLKDNGTITLDGFNFRTGDTSTFEGGNAAYYKQVCGNLRIINNSVLSIGDSGLIYGGNILLDDNSAYISSKNGFNLNVFETSGFLNAMNSSFEDYLMNDMIIGNNLTGKNQSNFMVDVYGRSNALNQHNSDRFIANNITEESGLSNAVINISDWSLMGDILGWDAPIDRDINLGNIFGGHVSDNISFIATKKEVFTPIGWYQLNNYGGKTGNYTLNLTRFNPQVYRGQVSTLAQWMNQLAINDILFNHSMLLSRITDEDLETGYSDVMANYYASVEPLFSPYQYSRKDGGLWYKTYGTFETMQMSQGLNKIGNNAYGALIGADFGLRNIKKGWKYMPTVYVGYNGAHQYYSGVGAYQNGGQIGFMNTLYKNNFILGGLIYGGVYDNTIDVAGCNDNTFNYFGGVAAKGAYAIRMHRDWVLQPNLLVAYNYFGQQNWHSTYGQMGMMSGMLNGVNISPGVNLIWEKETFSIYATLSYMYNANGAIGGRAGNVNLPHLCMDRGYIQYGLGFTKRISNRVSAYLQTVLRNAGRTGAEFQFGLNIQLGK